MKRRAVIMVVGYNCKDWWKDCLGSILRQDYPNILTIIADDQSDDGSREEIQKLVEQEDAKDQFILLDQPEKCYQALNNYRVATHPEVNEDDIIIELNLDDWFFNEQSVSYIMKQYENEDVFATHGSFIWWDGPGQLRIDIEGRFNSQFKEEHVRALRYPFLATRSFRAVLAKEIDEKDLKLDDGSLNTVGGDAFFYFPIIDMAGVDRIKYLDQPTYIYNVSHEQNDYKCDYDEQKRQIAQACEKLSYPRYEKELV